SEWKVAWAIIWDYKPKRMFLRKTQRRQAVDRTGRRHLSANIGAQTPIDRVDQEGCDIRQAQGGLFTDRAAQFLDGHLDRTPCCQLVGFVD
ncbi:MAG: hypothetical protein QF879_20690, partial [Candidatus Latescibacteria bacterium]|nr:hypothetical protein [Candidatus Latescibacterota bacterium]